MPKFNLMEALSERSREAAQEERREERREEQEGGIDVGRPRTVDIDDLVPSQENFYNTDDVSDIKASIELQGLLQPLLVTEPDAEGRYRVIAGHRRRLAILQLVNEGKEQYRKVDVMVRKSRGSILDELSLIMANRFREKNDWSKMVEAMRTEDLVKQLREEIEVEGRTRDLLAEIVDTSPTQLARYKAINNHLTPPLMRRFKEDKFGISVAYELSQLDAEAQAQATLRAAHNGTVTLKDVEELRGRTQIPGQSTLTYPDGNVSESDTSQNGADAESWDEAEEQSGNVSESDTYTDEGGGDSWDPSDPHPEHVTSICYNCAGYEACTEKGAAVASCDSYRDRREAQKTDEQRYNEEQAAIDRETAKKLQEREDAERMAHLPSDGTSEASGQQSEGRVIRISPARYEDIYTARLSFLLEKDEDYKLGEALNLIGYHNGAVTGYGIKVRIKYILRDWAGLQDGYCVLGFGIAGAIGEEEAKRLADCT